MALERNTSRILEKSSNFSNNPVYGEIFSSDSHMSDILQEQHFFIPVDRAPSHEELTSLLALEKPELIEYLNRTGEKIVNIERVPFVHPNHLPEPLSVLQVLSGAEYISDIGRNGIPFAAANTKENKNIKELEIYSTGKFYRDGDEIASSYLEEFPELMHGLILEAASLQGLKNDDLSEEEYGRILHEYRLPGDERGKDIGWPWPYYGAVDTTPAFINNIISYRKKVGTNEGDILSEEIVRKDGSKVEIKKSVQDAADWLIKRMSQNPEGLIEFKSSNSKGIANQVWKDSGDAYFHKDGTLANHKLGIAPIEVQVAAYNAFIGLADLFPEKSEEYANYANHLKKQIFEIYWSEKKEENEGYFVIGTDRDDFGNLRKLDILTSNAASVLNSDLLQGSDSEIVRKRELLVKTLFSEKMWSNAGLRTLSSKEVRFHPDAYHNGSVWLQDTADFARGLDRIGYHDLSGHVWNKIKEVIHISRMYPEKVSGDEGAFANLNRWNVDVITPEGKKMRISQVAQVLQGFALSAYKEALDRDVKLKNGLLRNNISDSEKTFEKELFLTVSELEKRRVEKYFENRIPNLVSVNSIAAD